MMLGVAGFAQLFYMLGILDPADHLESKCPV